MRHVNNSALETELWNCFLTLAYSKTVNISGFYITSKHLMWKNFLYQSPVLWKYINMITHKQEENIKT